MLVSICLPVFNGSRYLDEAIKSVLEQTYTDWELLIADDASDDGSWTKVEEYAVLDPRIKICQNNERLGLFSNYNRTIGSASGDFIKLFAQDDLMSPSAIATMVKALTNNQTASMVACGKAMMPDPVIESDNGNKPPAPEDKPVEAVADSPHAGLSKGLNPGKLVILKCLAQYRNLVGEPVAVMFRRQYQVEFSREYRSIGDLELWFRLLEKGDLFYIPEPLVTFRQHAESRSSELLKDLDWVLDIPRLSRSYSHFIGQLGIDRHDYCSRFLELAAPLVKEHCSTEMMFVDSLPPYKELAYYLLRRLPSALDGESNYQSVLNSTSWRVTKPLRFFKKKTEK